MSDSCDSVDGSPPCSSVHGISQARLLEWVAIPFSRRSSWPRDQTQGSCRLSPALKVDTLSNEPQGKSPKMVWLYLIFTMLYFTFNWRIIALQCSDAQQCKCTLAISVHISPPSPASLLPRRKFNTLDLAGFGVKERKVLWRRWEISQPWKGQINQNKT